MCSGGGGNLLILSGIGRHVCLNCWGVYITGCLSWWIFRIRLSWGPKGCLCNPSQYYSQLSAFQCFSGQRRADYHELWMGIVGGQSMQSTKWITDAWIQIILLVVLSNSRFIYSCISGFKHKRRLGEVTVTMCLCVCVCVCVCDTCLVCFRQGMPVLLRRLIRQCPAKKTSLPSMSGRNKSWRWRRRKVSAYIIKARI